MNTPCIQETSSQLPPHIHPQIAQIIRSFANDTKQLLHENMIAEYLFGSYATHTETPLSDIDILIIVKHATPELQWQMGGLASDYSLQYDQCISPLLQDLQVWEKNQQYQTLFYQEVMQHGVRL
ncbi:putative nucleotidyltransferase domain protein [Candidatus Vecturithrix granuli]|uniref:Putative nucleotidyltransferase domain protein n=1 Tax=Vecturithrix granuli TaxID=1499967 RepID=A0A081C5K4_VECG1|nr:putative nucleotidyltransferase domain protein [Candidatus Vecturithrix granuli]